MLPPPRSTRTRRHRRGTCRLDIALTVAILGLTVAFAVPGWKRERSEKAEKAAAKKAGIPEKESSKSAEEKGD